MSPQGDGDHMSSENQSERRRVPRRSCVGKMPGLLIRSSGGEPITCMSVDVSRFGLGIVASSELFLDEILVLQLPKKSVELKIVASTKEKNMNNLWRYGLVLLDTDIDLEQIFSDTGCIKPGEDQYGKKSKPRKGSMREYRERAKRYSLNKDLYLNAKTLGTKSPYTLVVENISKSGMLVSSSEKKDIPFNVNTILEIELDTEKTWLDKPTTCMGKVVRTKEDTADDGEERVYFGIMIIQMTDGDSHYWDFLINQLEKKFGKG